MRHKIQINAVLVLLAGIVLFSFSACGDEFFNREAGDRITPDLHYNALEYDLLVSTVGVMVSLQDFMPKLVILDGLRSDIMDVTENASLELRNINEHIYSSENSFIDASGLYKVIVNANEVLSYIDTVRANDVNFDDHVAHYWTGELIAMRSWAYFTIARLYNQVSYIEDNLTSIPDNLDQLTLTKGEIIDTLINQLLPYIYDPSKEEKVELKAPYFVNPKAILGELYLEQGDFQEAITYLKMACESFLNDLSGYKVDKTYQNEGWANIFFNAESQSIENISIIPFNRNEDQNNPLANWFGHDYEYLVKPSQILVDAYMNQIPSAGSGGDQYRGRGVTFGLDTISKESETVFETEAYITKYEIDWNEPTSSDIIIQRAADLHLLLAEAYNQLGDLKSQEYATMFLNKGVNGVNPKPAEYTKWRNNAGIRGRVYLKEKTVPRDLFDNPRTLYIEELLLEERMLELAYEGKRWFDLVRIAERRGNPAFLADIVAEKFKGTPKYNEVRARLMDPNNWYLPVD
ncbi:RagB/SusD family nutrient uptake outer membrane protein [Bacteroidota bacterium]